MPTEPGYYWMKTPDGRWHPVEVQQRADGLAVYWIANEAGMGLAGLPDGTEFRGPLAGPDGGDEADG